MLLPKNIMADPVNMTSQGLSELVWSAMPQSLLNNFGTLFGLAKAIGILFIIYVAFLIVKAVIQTRQALRIKTIEQTLISINEKLEQLVGKKEHKKDKKSKE